MKIKNIISHFAKAALAAALVSFSLPSWAEKENVNYVDEKGDNQTHEAIVLTGTETELSGDWYVVKENISFDHTISFKGDAKIILSDNATMKCGTKDNRIPKCISNVQSLSYSLTLYGQTNGTGTLQTYSSGIGIYVSNNFSINGGNIIADATGEDAILCNQDIIINRGNVSVCCENRNAINCCNGNLIMNGGNLTATTNASSQAAILVNKAGSWDGSFILNGGTVAAYGFNSAIKADVVALNFTDKESTLITEGSITALRGSPKITIADGVYLFDGTQTYSGSLTPFSNKTLVLGSYTNENDEITLVNPTREGYTFLGWTYEGQDEPVETVTIPNGSTGNKEFIANWQQKFGALTLVYAGDRTTATLQGEFTSAEKTSLEIDNSIDVSELTFQRTFKAGVPATVMLPFSFAADKVDGKFYTLASVAPINGVWTATMSNPINGIIKANTPYIFKANSNLNKLTFENGDDGVTLQSTKINVNGSGDWTLHGVYEKTFLGDPNQVNYGFAGQATDDGISVGDFIRAGDGVWADPMRCYLTYNKNNGVLAKSALDLPDNIRVVFPDEVEQPDNGEIVTPVSEFTPENGVKVWSFDGTVYIEAQPDMDYTIVDLTGRIIKKGVTHSTHEELNLNTKCIVIVKIGNKSFKLK